MADKRKYTETLAEIKVEMVYIRNHLGNLDKHLEKINTTNLDQEVKILRNKDRINLLWKIGGGGCGTIIIAGILKLFGVY